MNRQIFEEHIRYILDYWTEMVDWSEGGIHHYVRRFSKGPHPGPKSLLINARQMYNYSVGAEMGISGSSEIAEHIYSALDGFFRDRSGFYKSYSVDLFCTKEKRFSAYDQLYLVIGMARYASVLGGKRVLRKAERLFRRIVDCYGDGRYSERGIYGQLELSSGKLSSKSENCFLHHCEAVVNLLEAGELLLDKKELEKQKRELVPVLQASGKLLSEKIYNKSLGLLNDSFSEDMQPSERQEYSGINPAHGLEWIGFLYEGQLFSGINLAFLNKTGRKLAADTFRICMADSGAFMNSYFIKPRRCIELADFWGQAEAVLGAMFCHSLYGGKYLEYAEKLLDFYLENFIDHKYGGIFSVVHIDGFAVRCEKGYHFKCDHHSLRMCEKILKFFGDELGDSA